MFYLVRKNVTLGIIKNIEFKKQFTTKQSRGAEHPEKFKIVGKPKHFPPMTREWTNSVYSYDPDFLKNATNNYNLANKLLKGYFSLSNNLINSKRVLSRRLKGNLFRKTLNKILVSNPEIKINNDKLNLTVYIFNNEKRVFLKKLLNIKLKKSFLYLAKTKKVLLKLREKLRTAKNRSLLINKNSSLVKTLKKNILLKKTLSNYIKILFIRKKNRKNSFRLKNKRHSIKQKMYIKLFKNAKYINQIKKYYNTNSLTRNLSFLHKVFYFKFLVYICSLFEVNLNVKDYIELDNKDLLLLSKGIIKDIITLETSNVKHSADISYLHKNCNNFTTKKDILNILYNNRNVFITQFLINIFNKSNLQGENLINHFFKVFSHKYYFVFLEPKLKDDLYNYRNYIKFLINKYKFSKLLPGLKKLIAKIYSKKVEINLINLKNPNLNSDIFLQCLAFYLKSNSKRHLSKLLHKFTSIVKIKEKKNSLINKNISNIDELTYYKSTKFNFNNLENKNENSNFIYKEKNDFLQKVLDKLYYYSFADMSLRAVKINKTTRNLGQKIDSESKIKDNLKLTKLNKLTSFLNNINYKYIVGMRIKASGRLSIRNTAERARKGYKYIGHLRDLNYPNHFKWTKTPKSMLRNTLRANNTYSSISSKRRIGSFGIKGWISGGL